MHAGNIIHDYQIMANSLRPDFLSVTFIGAATCNATVLPILLALGFSSSTFHVDSEFRCYFLEILCHLATTL